MSIVKLKYEALISGIYPFEGKYDQDGFEIVEHTFDENMINELHKVGTIYYSPYILSCSCPNIKGDPVYLTLEKEETRNIDYGECKKYDVKFTNKYIEDMDLFEELENFEEALTLIVNNDIKFPVKRLTVYDSNGKYVTMYTRFISTNTVSVWGNDENAMQEEVKRQNNRLSSKLSYEKVEELRKNNERYDSAFSLFYSSYSVVDQCVSFALLVSSLESILSASTYEEISQCSTCGQKKFQIRSSVSENASKILMDDNDIIKRKVKKLYDKRSDFLHKGKRTITKEDCQVLQEYARSILLMYWFVSMNIKSFDHGKIMKSIISGEAADIFLYKNFLIGLDNASFAEKKEKMMEELQKMISKGCTIEKL